MATVEEQDAIRAIFQGQTPKCIVELGAHTGEDEPWIRAAANNRIDLLYLLVEPDPTNAAKISYRGTNVAGATRGRQVVMAAVSNKDGVATFHRSFSPEGVRGSGSLLRPTGHLKHFPQIIFDDEISVPVYTLDSLYKIYLGPGRIADLLWVDIQGAEGLMIESGKEALSRTRYLFIEAEEVEFYEGQTLKPDLVAMLPGWSVVKDFGYNLLLKNECLKSE